jgi:sugar transferase (PEP-CTERM/EpsH1 system associated)
VRILYLCHRFPFPPKRGGKIRPFNVIKHLARAHDVTVASLVRSEQEARAGEGLAGYCKAYLMERVWNPAAVLQMVLRLPSPTPSSMGFFYSPRLTRRIAEELASSAYDLVLVHCAFVAPYVRDVRGIPKILDFGDMDSQKWLAYAKVKPLPYSLGYRLEGWKMRRAEIALARHFDYCTCTTRAELATLDGFRTGVPSDWYPNGVDTDYFTPGDEPYDPDTIAFVGRMDYYPNQDGVTAFCRDTLPLLRARRPTVKLLIVGADPSPAIKRLGRVPGVTVTGSVVEVPPIVRKVALTIAPLSIARGTQNKILESLAMGVPVVSSSLAAAGVDAVPGEHLFTADTPETFAAAILRLLGAPQERRRLAKAGRARMLSNHSWTASMRKLDAIIDDCLMRRQGG